MTDDEKHTLAAEYSLGLLNEEQSRHCEALIATDPGFATHVERWRRDLTEIDMTATPSVPADELWRRIENAVAAAPLSVRPQVPVARTGRRGLPVRLWESLAAWRTIGLAGAIASVVLAIGLVSMTRDMARTPVLVAVMMSDQSRPLALVNAFRDGRTELVPLEALSAPEGKSLQVWTLWDRARGPVSVGLLSAMRSIDLKVDELPPAVPDQLFEVTLEPAGGSPTGRPTGPILMKGNAAPTDTGV